MRGCVAFKGSWSRQQGGNYWHVSALRTRLLIPVLSVVFCFGVAGCEPDNDVYIQNQTDQKLYFVIIGDDGSWNQTASRYPQKTTTVGVLGSVCAAGQFLVADAGRNVVKRFDHLLARHLFGSLTPPFAIRGRALLSSHRVDDPAE